MNPKIQQLFSKYGRTGIFVYFSIFFLTLFTFWALLTTGIDIRSWSFFSGLGNIGTIGIAYAATKITQPIRIAATVLVTPIIVGFLPTTKEDQEESS